MVHLNGGHVESSDCRRSLQQATPHPAHAEAVEPDPDDAAGLLQPASLAGVAAVGPRAGKQERQVQTSRGRDVALPPRSAAYDGRSRRLRV